MNFKTQLLAAVVAAGFATAAVPAFAQDVEEITVVGSIGPDGTPTTLSRAVTISDLDLKSDAGVKEMRTRIRATARDLCRELGESPSASPLSPSLPTCETAAVRTAMGQARMVVAQVRATPDYAFVEPDYAPAAESYAPPASAEVSNLGVPAASYTSTTVTNGPVADTPENRARFGGPMSNGGRKTAPVGN
jgi:UrcA family protein